MRYRELSKYEKAQRITKLHFYVGELEAHELCRKYNDEELNNMYIIGNILREYTKLLDD